MQKNEIAVAVAGIDTERDWVEDFGHENGRYQCRCIDCGKMFYGHKRRVMCKVCSHLDIERPHG